MNGNLKKSTVVVTILLILIVTALVGFYAFLSNRKMEAAKEAEVTVVQQVLNRNLSVAYPGTPKEVTKFYTEIQKCFYNEVCTDAEIEQLGMKARELFDSDLLSINEVGTYLDKLKKEITDFKAQKKKLTSVNVAASANVDYFTEDGYEFARIYCGYTVLDEKSSTSMGQVYLLRKDENKRWKIYGWDSAANVNPE